MAKYDLETLKTIYPEYYPYTKTFAEDRPKHVNFEELEGKTIVEIHGMEVGNDVIYFVCDDGTIYMMYHEQDCCESVDINDICGDVDFLLNTPITLAEKVTETGENEDYDSFTWTFYNFGTIKGYVTLRWYGESNGYYSESVDFVRCTKTISEALEHCMGVK